MAKLQVDELVKLKEDIVKCDLLACRQILFHFVDILLIRPSVMGSVLKMAVEDGVKYSAVMAEKKEGGS